MAHSQGLGEGKEGNKKIRSIPNCTEALLGLKTTSDVGIYSARLCRSPSGKAEGKDEVCARPERENTTLSRPSALSLDHQLLTAVWLLEA